jgi:hypothetical protein
MFGSTSGSPYGAAGLLTSGNYSSGRGGPLGYGNLAPLPSGGAPSANIFSVYNKSLDSETLPQPTVLLHPSRHATCRGAENSMSPGDFLMVLRPTGACEDLRSREAQYGLQEVALLTIPAANKLLRDQARQTLIAQDSFWFSHPDVVADTIRPFGALINKMEQQTYGGGIDRHSDNPMVNVQVSRRVNIKNNFYPALGKDDATGWSRSTQVCGIMYRPCSIQLQDSGNPQQVVQLFPVRLPSGQRSEASHDEPEIESTNEGPPKCSSKFCSHFERAPCTRSSVIIPIGRVLNSSLTNPKAHQCVSSAITKSSYDMLKTIEVELGCA